MYFRPKLLWLHNVYITYYEKKSVQLHAKSTNTAKKRTYNEKAVNRYQ